jgi:hypothetical protein
MLCPVAIIASAQPSNGGGILNAAQAEAGRIAYEKTCGRCHTLTLMGRQGKPGERPAVSSLSEADQQFINNYSGRVPPEAKFSFEEAGLTDDESIVDITAYVLQVNGAKAGSRRLTRTTDAIVSSATSNSESLSIR